MGEFELVRRLGPFLHGAGDDAALVQVGERPVLIATDVLVDGVHVDRSLSSLADVGWKAIAVNVSDMAAMGAQPLAATVGLCLPDGLGPEDVEELYTGMAEACRRWDLRLVGGDTATAAQLVLAVTVIGEPPPGGPVWRSGARPGDRLVLAGELGAAAAALAQHAAGRSPAPELIQAHRRPQARLAEGLALAAAGATAMIDVSDGLGADLGHLCAASGVHALVEAAALPVADGVVAAAEEAGIDVWDLVCGGGEDFALLAAVPAATEHVPGVDVGQVLAAGDEHPPVRLVLPDGTWRDIGALGYEHPIGGAGA